ncbi:MAG: nuclear transport factor 2 family protein [Crocinitomicaceae bacterium]
MKKLIALFLLTASLSTNAQSPPDSIVQLSLDAYNNHEFELFMSFFAEDVEMFNLNQCEPYAKGIDEVRNLYKGFFDASPNLHSEIKQRMVFDNKVMDYEYVTGARGSSEPFEIIFMYEIEGDKIVRTTAIRK